MIRDDANPKDKASAHGPAVTLPCALAQQRFWFLEQLEPGNPALNVAVRWRMSGTVSDAAVAHAFQALQARHEILRTRFTDIDGEPRQAVAADLQSKITMVDLSRLTGDQRTRETEAISLREASRPFDLVAGPPVRLATLRLDERNIVILLTMHHIATDGWTMGLLAHEFGALVAEAMSGTPAELAPLEMQYADYALWQADMLAQGAFDGDADFWKTTLKDLPRFEVQPDKPRPARLGTAGDFRLRNPLAALMEQAEALARRQGQTMYTLAASALAMALAAETGQTDIVMGTQVAGREDMLLEPLAGLFINTIVLRFDLHAATTSKAVNERCRAAIDGAMAHQRYPFEKLVEMLNPPRDPARTPLYSVNFTLIRPVIQSETFGDIELISLPSQLTGAQYDLLFFMVKRADGWRMVCESSSSLYETSTPDRILGRWEAAFRQLVAAPEADVGRDWSALGALQSAPALAAPPAGDTKSELAAGIAAIWRDCLGRPDLGTSAHFFDCGGHSLLALRMLARVRTLTGTAVPVARLFEYPVLADFIASFTGGERPTVDPQIAHVQPHGHKSPFIALNDGAVYHAVAQKIGLDRPFIDLHLASKDGGTFLQPTGRFEEFAAEAVQLIKRAQPEGPYTLVGHCIFGAVALEAAQQLRRAGDDVSLVVMLDTLAPGYVEDMPWYDRVLRKLQLLRSSGRYFLELWGKLNRGELALASVLFQYGFIRRNGVVRFLEGIGVVKPVKHTPEDYAEIVFGNHLLDARRAYRLKPYAGDVLQFRAETAREGRLFDKGFGWGRWIAGTYDVIDVPSDHFNMLRTPAADVIGRRVAEQLDRVEARARRR
jgi:thioesterase domain-containing protein